MSVPQDFPRLENLRPGEEVQMVMKRHWIVLVRTFVYLAVLIKIPLFLFLFRGDIASLIPLSYVTVFTVIFLAVFALFIYVDWLSNELDFFVFTNERIIGVDQISFLNRAISECSMDRVQEVNAFSKGLLANIFNFGTVDIRTASEDSRFEMHVIPAPVERAREILNIVQEFKTRHPGTSAPAAPKEASL
ncbi:MAG: hypothetical protein QG650_432 [Patescibacteria group bacterium]|nr:hypothetical protein [Patescibacteria group bacterium]